MKTVEFSVVTIDRIELRDSDSESLKKLNALGQEGWHIAYVREDVQRDRNLLFIMEREIEKSGT